MFKKITVIFMTSVLLFSSFLVENIYASDASKETENIRIENEIQEFSEDYEFDPSLWDIDLSASGVARLTKYHVPVNNEFMYIPGGYIFGDEEEPRQLVMDSWQPLKNYGVKNTLKKIVIQETYGMKFLVKSTVWNKNESIFTGMGEEDGDQILYYADLSGLETGHVRSLRNYFRKANAIEYLNLDGWDTSSLQDMVGTFAYMHNLDTLDLSSFDTSNVQHMSWMFYDSNMSYVNLSSFTTESLMNYPNAFPGVSYNGMPTSYMFEFTPNFKIIDLTKLDISHVAYPTKMFDEKPESKAEKLVIAPVHHYKNYNYASHNIKPLTVFTLDANGGSFTDNSDLFKVKFDSVWYNSTEIALNEINGKIGNALPEVEKDDHVFIEWEGLDTVKFNSLDELNNYVDAEFQAKWAPTQTVHWHFNNSNFSDYDEELINNETITVPNKTEGIKEIVGWYTDDGTFLNEISVNVPDEAAGTVHHYYAKWDTIKHTVTFDSNDGTTVGPVSNVTHGNTISKPADPSKTGFKFDGWYKDTTLTTLWDFDNDTVTDNTTLYAGWTPLKYTVTFNSNNGTPVDPILNVGHDVTISKPEDPTKTGFKFGGWYKDTALTTLWDFDNDTVTDNTTLYADWTPLKYTVTFNSNNGTPVDPILNVGHDVTISKPTEPTKTGFKFDGWYKDTALTTLWDFDNDTVTDNTTLYAGWTPLKYTVTFNSNNGTPVAPISNVGHNATITKPADPSKTGFKFDGWYKDTALTTIWDFDVDTVTDNTTLYASWTPLKYTVTFNSNNGTPVASISDVGHNATITKPAEPSKTGFKFDGWYKDTALTILWDFENDTITDNTTLYAGWTPLKYTVTFNSNDGTPVAPISNVGHNATITKPTDPTKKGFTFAGWYKNTALTILWDFDVDTVTNNTTLYAGWTPLKYTVTFDSNDGSAIAPILNVSHDAKISKPTAPTKAGFKFDGWYKDTALTTLWDFDVDTVREDITLYAKWTKNTEKETDDDKLPQAGYSSSIGIGYAVLMLGIVFVIIAKKENETNE